MKYELLNVEFGLMDHEEEEKSETLTLQSFSSLKLKKLATSNTKKHQPLEDDDDCECAIGSTIIANTMSPVAMLDGLVKSFEYDKH